MSDDPRRFAAATDRNREPILAVLERVLPEQGFILEVASGTGQHAAYFASRLYDQTWQPSDPDPELRDSIDAWRDDAGIDNLLPAIDLDVTWPEWPVTRADAIVAINMLHIAPWEVCHGLMRGAARLLAPGAPLVLYGPFKVAGHHTSPGNAEFDRELRDRNRAFGIRDLDEVRQVAQASGLRLDETIAMPANNLTLVFRREGEPA